MKKISEKPVNVLKFVYRSKVHFLGLIGASIGRGVAGVGSVGARAPTDF